MKKLSIEKILLRRLKGCSFETLVKRTKYNTLNRKGKSALRVIRLYFNSSVSWIHSGYKNYNSYYKKDKKQNE